MNTIKKFISALALCALASVSAAAQSYNLQTTAFNGGTGNVSLSSTNTTTNPVFVGTKASTMTIQAQFKLDGAGTTAVMFLFDSSVDGTIWAPRTHSLLITPAGTAVKGAITNVPLGSIGYLKLVAIENANSQNITNLYLKYSTKNGL